MGRKADAGEGSGSSMRILFLVLALAFVSGCLGGSKGGGEPTADADSCATQLAPVQYYFSAGHSLVNGTVPAKGSEPGNAFSSGFLTNDLKEWLSEPVEVGIYIIGIVTLDYWAESTGSPAPLAIGGSPGEAYHFFNQFGTDRTLQPSYATEYSSVALMPGDIDHYTASLEMPPGGFFVESGDRLRVLLTDLALDGTEGSGHNILYGGETPSSISFEALCIPTVDWLPGQGGKEQDISIAANQGLLTGAIPAGDNNRADVGIIVSHATQRMTITLTQTNDRNPVKDDIDIELLDANGTVVWSIGSPYSDEAGTLWGPNLDAIGLRGEATVRVNSYSGFAYTGHVSVVQENALDNATPY